MSAESRPTISLPVINVRCAGSHDDPFEYSFQRQFRIGRSRECEVVIDEDVVSRAHAEVRLSNGRWSVHDLGSSNGIYVGDQRIVQIPVGEALVIRLGIAGPEVAFEVERVKQDSANPPSQPVETMIARYVERYFSEPTPNEGVGEHTMFLRRAFHEVKSREKRIYGKIIGALMSLVLIVATYAVHEHRQIDVQRATAKELFYAMKSLDVDIADAERIIADTDSQAGAAEIKKLRIRRGDIESDYDRFLSTLNVYNPKMSSEDNLVLRVARIFGECEIDMPRGFVDEVKRYIKLWQSSGRYAKAIRIAEENGYAKPIANEFLAHGLPPQFFYLAMQESNFNPYAVGPITRKGYAKGMWQFVPETAVKYGLHLGPLVDLNRPDPGDDRDHYEKATRAAALYIQELYANDAQASGFLVMACYNWGEDQVLPMVRSMPANPRERNFWKLFNEHRDKIPQETYDYVFYIVSAAVIGENPRLFGFDFDSPLASKTGDDFNREDSQQPATIRQRSDRGLFQNRKVRHSSKPDRTLSRGTALERRRADRDPFSPGNQMIDSLSGDASTSWLRVALLQSD